MKRNIISGLALVVLSTTAIQANDCPQKHNFGHPKKEYMMKNHMHIMQVIQSLDLTHTQRKNIRTIVEESRAKRDKVSDAFTQSEFNKSKFIVIMQKKRDNRVQKEAELIAKVYTLLTLHQKKELKMRLDFKRERKCFQE